MSDMINLTIDGKICQAKEGEYILNVARANNIYVPAICYLTRCSPTLACRLCLVEADGKQVYSCNTKAKEGMQIQTVTENIVKERRAIMEVYDVNHPLQCGVCDQSGDCELQNNTLYMKVDSQSYSIKDVNRPTTNWGVMNYDAGLCIVCEKCVTVCKDMIGSSALSTVKRDSEGLNPAFKESMPKDAYAMWNKLNKSLIGYEADKCIDCGECISVCPVGALVSEDFQYKSNAWELTRIPASNPHSSDCALIYYEVKHTSTSDTTPMIYRVTNEHHYANLSGAARFGYDFENKNAQKDETQFAQAIEAFKKAQTITFNSYITNEEALILEKLREKLGLKLVNHDALRFQKFMKNYAQGSGSSLYNATLQDIHDANLLISVGSFLKSDAPSVKYGFNNAITRNKGAGLYFHPLGDTHVEGFGKKGKTIETISHNPLCEESILFLILDLFGKELPSNVQTYLDSLKEKRVKTISEVVKENVTEMVKDEESGEEKEVTKVVSKTITKEVEYELSKLFNLIGSDESLLETINAMRENKDALCLIVGEDLIFHPKSANLAKLCGLIEKHTDFKVMVVPPQTNTLGVSLICELFEREEGFVVGYNEKANYELSSFGNGNLNMPALNQQEGTFTNFDKRVVPTNVALPYGGYVLNDLANVLLEEDIEYTIEYTPMLPTTKGFKAVEFDSLPNYFGNDKSENRGYLLSVQKTASDDAFETISNIDVVTGNVIYKANPINQFNEFTSKAHQLNETSALYVSSELLESLKLKEGERVTVRANSFEVELPVEVDNQMIGHIGYVSFFDKSIPTSKLFSTSRYSGAVIKKV
ncbi:MAG: NADH-quinone oxidoreductase subunit G [Candidatus Marinarcus sp.]|uniref:NADH-quinone oxidoreductase subunit G n=1 Tax=Candidatus Marinarcus sp. TaxID=3100987 RepID=UPI003B00FE0E